MSVLICFFKVLVDCLSVFVRKLIDLMVFSKHNPPRANFKSNEICPVNKNIENAVGS